MHKKHAFFVTILGIATTSLWGFTTEQEQVYPQNPALVRAAGSLNDPKIQKQLVVAMDKANKVTTAISAISGTAALLLTPYVFYRSQSISARATAMMGSVALAAVSAIAAIVAQTQKSIADRNRTQEEASSPMCTDEICSVAREASDTNNLSSQMPASVDPIRYADGLYIISAPSWCPPCKDLQTDLRNNPGAAPLKAAIPRIIEFDTQCDAIALQEFIQKTHINVQSLPLLVVVQDHVIVRIILGYSGIEDLWENNLKDLFA